MGRGRWRVVCRLCLGCAAGIGVGVWRGVRLGCARGGAVVSVVSGAMVGGLLERGIELARVDGLLEQASNGVGAVVVVEGVAGIGKSELLAAVVVCV